jgi:membrane protease subunit HflC
MTRVGLVLLALVALGLLLAGSGALYTVDEREQVIVTQFGRPVGAPVVEAGLHVKLPFIQRANRLERRILEFDGRPNEMPTKDKLYIVVDTFARWRIADPLQYFLRMRDERSAQSRLEDILGSETRNAVAKHDLIEIVRSTKGRVPAKDESLGEAAGDIGELRPIKLGRGAVEAEIFKNASGKLLDLGIELLDLRLKRINYNQQVQSKIFERMISEREQIASRFRSEGEGEAARILGEKERDVKTIESEAYRKIQEIRGTADARATEIYADAYGKTGERREFFDFQKTLETYETALGKDTTLVLTTKGDLFGLVKGDLHRPPSP